jgi:cytochrome c biogenesis protein CcdA
VKKPLILLGLVVLAAIVIIVVGFSFIPKLKVRAEVAGGLAELLKTDADRVTRANHIYVDITFATDEFLRRVRLAEYIGRYRYGQTFLVSLNTHAGNIEGIVNLDQKISLIDDQGNRYPHLGSPIMTSLHHNTYVIIFPNVDHREQPLFGAERKYFTIEVRDIPPFERREFTWSLPIQPIAPAATRWEAWTRSLMLGVALIGALTITLSPCAINVGAFYSAVLATTLGRADVAAIPDQEVKKELLRVLLPFAIGFTVLFSAAGALIGWTGSVLRNPLEQLGDYWTYVRLGAGLVMLYLGLRLVASSLLRTGAGRLALAVGRLWRQGVARVFSLIAGERLPAEPRAFGEKPFTPLSSLFMGIAMSTECVICLGTGIFFPLAVYAGTTSWYWGMATLGAFSIALVIPMFLVAFGVRDLRLTLPRKMTLVRGLNAVAGLIIGFVGLELIRDVDPHRFTNLVLDVVFGGTAWLYR